MFKCWFFNACTQQKFNPSGFPAVSSAPQSIPENIYTTGAFGWRPYCIETESIRGCTYHWVPSSPNIILDGDEGVPGRCYFHGTTPGSYYITLGVDIPAEFSIGSPYLVTSIERTIPITILPALATPNIHYEQSDPDANICEYDISIDPVPNATGYLISKDGGNTYNLYPSTVSIIDAVIGTTTGTPVDIRVIALNYCNYSGTASLVTTLYKPSVDCYRLEQNDSTELRYNSGVTDLVKAYPSPSNGDLWLENNSASKIVVTLKSINGITLTNFTIDGTDKKKINGLPEGMLIMEAKKEDNTIVSRKLLPIIHL